MTEQERVEVLIARVGSAKELAYRIGVSKSSMSKLRSGKFHLAPYAQRLAEAFPAMNCRWLLTGKGDPFAKEPSDDELLRELKAIRRAVEKR